MKKAASFIFIMLLFFLIVSSVSAITLTPVTSSPNTPEPLIVFKGQSVKIPFELKITNSEQLLSVDCNVNSELNSKSIKLSSQEKSKTEYFDYKAPDKIKGIQGTRNILFETVCIAKYQESCGFLWLDTCTYTTDSAQFSHSVTIKLDLNEQDKKNLEILNKYTSSLSSDITSTDINLKKIKDLIDKTPSVLKPVDSSTIYSTNSQKFNQIKSKYESAIKNVEEESYNSAPNFISYSEDLSSLKSIDSQSQTLISTINTNVDSYQKIVSSFNAFVSDSTNNINKYNTQSNADLIDKFNLMTKDSQDKLEGFTFSSLVEAQNIVDNYKEQYNGILQQLREKEKTISITGFSILKTSTKEICSNSELCEVQNRIKDLNNLDNVVETCSLFDDTLKEVNTFNEGMITKYNNDLVKLGYHPNTMPAEDKIQVIETVKTDINGEVDKLNKDVLKTTRGLNNVGKKIDLINYSNIAIKFNEAPLADKKKLLLELESEQEKLKAYRENVIQEESSFVLFFKRIYYYVLGEKQDVTNLNLEKIENSVKPNEDLIEFYNKNCEVDNTLVSNNVKTLEVSNVDYKSDVKTEIKEPEKTCFDENGARTTNCCNTDEYRNRKDLYPVIFVHGHAMETGDKVTYNSLNTFKTMESYFSNNGYVKKDLLYPEKSTELTNGAWAYCKPIVVRVTYYEGIADGSKIVYKNGIQDYSPTLRKQVDAVLTATNKEKAIIVSHSMGGIISRYYVKYDGGDSKVEKLITISGPHYGTRDLVSFGSGIGGAQESKQMQINSDFLNNLNKPSDSIVNSYSIMGDSQSCSLGSKRCDGVIYVEDASLKDAKDTIVFKGSQYAHSPIVNQADVAQKVIDFIKS